MILRSHTFPADADGVGSSSWTDVLNFCNKCISCSNFGLFETKVYLWTRLYPNIFMEFVNKMALLQKQDIWSPYSTFEVILSGRTYPQLFALLPFQLGLMYKFPVPKDLWQFILACQECHYGSSVTSKCCSASLHFAHCCLAHHHLHPQYLYSHTQHSNHQFLKLYREECKFLKLYREECH
jgi:hypothetical protein